MFVRYATTLPTLSVTPHPTSYRVGQGDRLSLQSLVFRIRLFEILGSVGRHIHSDVLGRRDCIFLATVPWYRHELYGLRARGWRCTSRRAIPKRLQLQHRISPPSCFINCGERGHRRAARASTQHGWRTKGTAHRLCLPSAQSSTDVNRWAGDCLGP